HEQEEMHFRSEHFLKFGARELADRLDRLPAGAERDLALALALDIDHLLDADRAVLLVLPLLRLHGELVGKLVMEPEKELLARDFRRERAQGHVGRLILRIMPRAL